MPFPRQETRVLNCVIVEDDLIMLVVDEAIMFLSRDLNPLSNVSSKDMYPSFIYFSCLTSAYGGVDFFLSGQVKQAN